MFLKLDGRANATPVAARFELRRAERRAEGAAVARAFAQVQVDRRADWTPAGAFSGGNQQKIAIAKWLVAQSRILLFRSHARHRRGHQARAVPADAPLCRGGRRDREIPETELAGEALTEAGIMRAALGGSESGRSAA